MVDYDDIQGVGQVLHAELVCIGAIDLTGPEVPLFIFDCFLDVFAHIDVFLASTHHSNVS